MTSVTSLVRLLSASRARRREQWLTGRADDGEGARSPVARVTPDVGDEIARQLAAKFGEGLRFEVVPVDDIPLAPSGKLQTIVPFEEPPGRPGAGELALLLPLLLN